MLGTILSLGSKIIGGIMGQRSAEADRRHLERREDSSIQRRVADSLKAGIHPVFGLGASVSSPAPVLTGQAAEGFSEAGQDLGRAIDATKSTSERGLSSQMRALQLRRFGLENSLIEEQILSERARRVGSPPPYPETLPGMKSLADSRKVPGQQDSGDMGIVLPGGGRFVAGPTDYEALERRYGEPADLYGAMMMAKHATATDQNWAATRGMAKDVADSILSRLLTVKVREGSLADRRATRRSAWMRRDPNGPSWRGRLPLTGRR